MIIEVEKLNTTNPFSKRIEYINNSTRIGYLDYSIIYERMEIDNFFVEEPYRNQKIGTKLMSHLISIAISNHVINITLEVRESNIIARNMYKKFGFREIAKRKFYYGNEDGILMEKQVM